MLADLGRFILEVLQFVWPLRSVEQWERGCYYVLGKYWRTVGPGKWPVLPYFMDVRAIITEPGCFPLKRQDITLRNGETLTFAATVEFQVVAAALAYNGVERWDETTQEMVSGILAEGLADAEPDRFDPARGKRDRLVESLVAQCNARTMAHGVCIRSLWFTTFARSIPTYRLVGGAGGLEP